VAVVDKLLCCLRLRNPPFSTHPFVTNLYALKLHDGGRQRVERGSAEDVTKCNLRLICIQCVYIQTYTYINADNHALSYTYAIYVHWYLDVYIHLFCMKCMTIV